MAVKRKKEIKRNEDLKRLSHNFTEKKEDIVKKAKIRIIGVGGGGSNIVSELANKVGKISCVVANTDKQALKSFGRNVLPFHFGEDLTHGLGAGMNCELAEKAALLSKDKIEKLFKGYDFCIIVSTLGGGTGSGATPVFAKIAKKLNVLTLGIFTLPFTFEGEKKQQIARDALQKLRFYFNSLIIVPNDRIFQTIEKNTPLKEAFSFINDNLAKSLQGLIETIYFPGIINIDFADLKAVLQGKGKIAYLNTIELEGEKRVLEMNQDVLSSPLYPYNLKGAKKILFNIIGNKELLLSDVSRISKIIFEQVFSDAKIIFGVSQNQEIKDKIKVCIFATGCSFKDDKSKTESTGKVLTQEKFSKSLKKKLLIKNKKNNRATKNIVLKNKIKLKSKFKTKSKPAEDKNLPAIKFNKQNKIKVNVNNKEKEVGIRKNALQVKKELEEDEKEILEKEKIWETPAFLRQQNKQ